MSEEMIAVWPAMIASIVSISACSFSMVRPFVKLVCVRAINVAKRAVHPFYTRRHFDGRIRRVFYSFTQIKAGQQGKAAGLWCGWAAGVFMFVNLHGCKFPFFVPF
jgi:hypothetical protein